MTLNSPLAAPRFDARRADVYLDHLAFVGMQQPCVATRDIYNQFGVLLLAKGTPISPKTAARLAGHDFDADIDSAIGLASRLTSRTLFDALARLLEQDADLATFGAVHQLPELARHVCLRRELPLAPMQKLTVMTQRLPQLFQRTLGGALLALLMARTLGWNGAALDDLFAAALFRDIGLLHLARVPDDAVTVPQYSPETLHHGAMSAAILQFESGFSAAVIAAVTDHHERPDGTGFPRGRHGAQVCAAAALVNAADTVWALRGEGSLCDLIPYLQVNAGTAADDPLRTLLAIVQGTGCPLPQPEDTDPTPSELDVRNSRLAGLTATLTALDDLLRPLRQLPLGITVRHSLAGLLRVIRSSGLDMQNGADVTAELAPGERAELARMQAELVWKLKRLLRLLPQLQRELQNNLDPTLHTQLLAREHELNARLQNLGLEAGRISDRT